MDKKREGFIIYGKVIGKDSKKAISNLVVEALDKDLLFDDRLGSAITDKEGNFEIRYDKEDFQKLFFEEKPDIFLRVKNPKGEIIFTTEDKVKYEVARVEEIDLVVSEKMIEKIWIENERLQFKHLTTINPNYFGNIIEKEIAAQYPTVYQMTNNTKYEELLCVGLYPEDNTLEAVIEIKLPYGYKGSLCTAGSKEYVAFYIDYDDGEGFVSVGSATEVNVHNLASVNGGHLFYAVRKPFIPKKYKACITPQVVKVRAILSWEKLPTGPNYPPVWGNVVDTWVQIKPLEIFPLVYPVPTYEYKVIEEIDFIPPIEKYLIMGDKEEIKELIDKSIEEEKRIKKEGKVEKQRFEFKKLITQNPNYFGSISKSTDKNEIMKAIYKLPQKTIKDILTFDPDELVPVETLLQNKKYEELHCVGLYPNNDLLEAVIEIKLPYGFSGDLCKLGSKEYVAFYIDWGSGYDYIATSTVAVHDIPEVQDKPLHYAVKAKIHDIEDKLKACTLENIVKVKAILSWNKDPTPYGHTHEPTWGNVLTVNIQIRPEDGESAKCDIEIVNEVHIDEISQSGGDAGLAIKLNEENIAVLGTFDRPFGGIVACWGNINVQGTEYYRFRYSVDNGVNWINVTDKRIARSPSSWSPIIERTPDIDGWFSKKDYETDVENYSLTALIHWRSYGKEGKYLLRLELGDENKNTLFGQTHDISLILDNTNPEVFTFGGTPAPLPAMGVTVKDINNQYKKCATFIGKDEIVIWGNFRDNYFKNFYLKVFGGNIITTGVTIGHGRYDSGISGINDKGIIGAMNGSLGQEIERLNLCTIAQYPDKIKCAYGIELTIYDRALVGYISGYSFNITHHRNTAFVTFDWDPTGCTS